MQTFLGKMVSPDVHYSCITIWALIKKNSRENLQQVTKMQGVGGMNQKESGEGEEALLSFCSSHRTISNYRTKATHSGSELQHCSFACLMSALLNAKRTPGCCWGLRTPMHHLRTTRSSSVPLWIGTSSLGLFSLNKPSLIRSVMKMYPDRWEKGLTRQGLLTWTQSVVRWLVGLIERFWI